MQTLYYIILSLLVAVIAIIILVRLYRRHAHLEKMAYFYREKNRWKEPQKGVYGSFKIMEDPLIDMGFINGQEINREIASIIKRFKKDPQLLKKTEKAYYEEEHRKAIEKENQKKELIKKRVFSYDYEDLLYRLYEPTAKEYLGDWQIEGIDKDVIIQRISEIKSISGNEAEELFKLFVEHDLIWGVGRKYELTPMLAKWNADWNIVSDTDMNFQKWMIKRELDKRKKN